MNQEEIYFRTTYYGPEPELEEEPSDLAPRPVEKPGHEPQAIKDMRAEERPRERLIAHGAQSLTVPELLAILIGTGSGRMNAIDLARTIYYELAEGNLDFIANLDADTLMQIKGIGQAKATTLLAAFELMRRKQSQTHQLVRVGSSREAVDFLRSKIGDSEHEVACAIFLTTSGRAKAFRELSRGSLRSVHFDVRKLVNIALQLKINSVIIAHNHPSGSTEISRNDIQMTRDIQQALALFHIQLLDSLIITQHAYASLREAGHIR